MTGRLGRAWRAVRDQVVAGAARSAGRRAARPLRGTLRLPGLAGPVRIDTDADGVPHIEAASEQDLVRAQGFWHGLERPFQLDWLRHALSGRLAGLVGDRDLGTSPLPPFPSARRVSDVDALLRILGLRRSAKAAWEVLGEEGRGLFAAYAGGVSAAFAPGAPRGRSLEHRVLRTRPAAWSPVDSLLVAKGMSLSLGFAWRSTPVFAAMAARLGDAPEHLRAILPRGPEAGEPTLLQALADASGTLLGFLPGPTAAVGSNAILVGAGRSASGAPLVATDPHLELGLPGVWHLASLAAAPWGAVGAALVGLPGIVLGRTAHLAWGLTNAMLDDGDLWVETIDSTGERYRLDGRWEPLAIESQTVPRRGGAPRVVRVRRTHRGPLLTDAFPGYTGPPMSVRLVLHEPTPDPEAFLALGRARTVDEALAAFDAFGSPAQNLVVADTAGSAAYRMIGRVPRRAAGHVPGQPLDGSTRATDWQGWVPAADLPRAQLAEDDILVTANDPIVGPPYAHHLSHLYEPDHRARRLRERLGGLDVIAPGDLVAAQRDVVNGSFLRLRATALAPHADAVRRQRPHLAPLLDRLLTWDGAEDVHARGAVLGHLLYHHLLRQVFGPRLGTGLLEAWMGQVNLVDAALHRAFATDDSPWAPAAQRPALIGRALDEVDRELVERGWGADVPYGAFHTLTLSHPLGGVPGLRSVLCRGPVPAPGGPFTPCSGQYAHARPGPMVVGPSYRHVVDLGDPSAARMMTFGGQSGHPLSPHYDDLTARWLAGDLLPMRMGPEPRPQRIVRLLPR